MGILIHILLNFCLITKYLKFSLLAGIVSVNHPQPLNCHIFSNSSRKILEKIVLSKKKFFNRNFIKNIFYLSVKI